MWKITLDIKNNTFTLDKGDGSIANVAIKKGRKKLTAAEKRERKSKRTPEEQKKIDDRMALLRAKRKK